jgi:hypothetical protein
MLSISRPTLPVAPTTAILKPIELLLLSLSPENQKPCWGVASRPEGERTGDDEAYSAVFAAVVAVFVLLVVRVSSAIAIVHPKALTGLRYAARNTPKARFRQAFSFVASVQSPVSTSVERLNR